MTKRTRILLAVAAAAVLVLAGWMASDKYRRRSLADAIERDLLARQVPAPPAAPIPPEEDAAPLWKEAIAALDLTVRDAASDALDLEVWPEVPTEVDMYLEANATALAAADAAAARPRCTPLTETQVTPRPWKDLQVLLECRARRGLYLGEGAEAVRAVRTLRSLARDWPAVHPAKKIDWVGPFLAARVQETALGHLCGVATAPSPAGREEALALALEPWEMRGTWDRYLRLLRDTIDRECIDLLRMGVRAYREASGIPVPDFKERVTRLFRRKRRDWEPSFPSTADIRRAWEHSPAILDPAFRRDVSALAPGAAADRAYSRSTAKSTTVDVYDLMRPETVRSRVRAETAMGVLQAALALRVFEARHGRPANSLEELVPDLLPAVPLDPGDGKPLRYESRPGGGAVWSVLDEGAWAKEREAAEKRKEERVLAPRIEWGTPPK